MISRIAIAGIFAAASLASIYAAASHYASLVDERASLRLQVETANQVLNRMALERKRLKEDLHELAEKRVEAGEERRRLAAVYARHDFGRLLLEKPGLMSRVINGGTARSLWLLQRATLDVPGGEGDEEASAVAPPLDAPPIFTVVDGTVCFAGPKQYENLSRDLAEIYRWVKEARSQLDYYRDPS